MHAFQHTRSWWQRLTGENETPLDSDTPAWLVSIALHVALLVTLSLCVIPLECPPIVVLTINQSEEIEPDLQHPDFVKLESQNPNLGDDAEATTEGLFDVQIPL